MNGSFLGPRFTDDEIGGSSTTQRLPGAPPRRRRRWPSEVAALLADEKVVGLLQGRMEFGPRALGGRSIIGDARSPKMQSVMNLKIKFRESFRPFAPAVLREHVGEWFELDARQPVHAAGRRRAAVAPPAGAGRRATRCGASTS